MEWIFLAALFNGAFLAFAVPFIKTRNKAGKVYLAWIFAVLALSLLDSYLILYKGWALSGLGLLGEFYLAPLIYLFAKSLVTPEQPKRALRLAMFAPAWAATAFLVFINLGMAPVSLYEVLDQRYWVTALWVGAKMVCIFAFLIPAFVVLSKHLETVPNAARKLYRPVRAILLVLGVLLLGVYVNFALYYFGLPGVPDSDNYSLLLVSFLLFALGLMVVARREILDGFYVPAAPRSERAQSLVKTLMEKNKLFRDPDLSLKGLAATTGLSEKDLSQACYQVYGKKFLDVVNGKRVQEFKALALATKEKPNILDLAFDAGFNSKATFYRAFRAAEGVSPSDFVKGLTSQNRR